MGNMSPGPKLYIPQEEHTGAPHIEQASVPQSASRDIWVLVGVIIAIALIIIAFVLTRILH